MFLNKQNLYILYSFTAGFSLMTVEIISSRIMSPIIGNSIYTWASIIGIVLFGLSIGSVLGGILADKFNNNKILPLVFLISGFFVFLISPLSEHTNWVTEASNSIILINIVLSAYLFLFPAITIGFIQPIVLKKYTNDFSKIGFKYGLLSTAWSLGSILGVFITGFYLISTIGSLQTIYFISFLLFFLSVLIALLNKEKKTLHITLISLVILAVYIPYYIPTHSPNIIYDKETSYYRVRVVDFNEEPYGESRALLLDFDTHSIESEKKIEYTYTEIYPLFKILKPDLSDILVIGGGAYTLPKALKNFYPEASVSVMEIDPIIEGVARDYFNLDPNLIKTITGDARFLINKSDVKYDLIYGDAYNSFISVPGQLLTREYNENIKKTLKTEGIYALNFISALQGEKSALYQSIVNTFIQTFPNYYIFAFDNENLQQIQSITLVGINGPDHQSESQIQKTLVGGENPFLAKKIILNPENYIDGNSLILTDDFYPTEKLISSTVKEYFPGFKSFIKKII